MINIKRDELLDVSQKSAQSLNNRYTRNHASLLKCFFVYSFSAEFLNIHTMVFALEFRLQSDHSDIDEQCEQCEQCEQLKSRYYLC